MISVTKRLCIICEDAKSAKLYFESFKKDDKLKRDLASVEVEVVHPKDHSPVGLVNKAKEKKKIARRNRNPYNEIWVVFDKDGHANIDNAMVTANDNRIKVAISVKCFEYWILLHFERSLAPFAKCDDIISHIKHNHLNDYSKGINYYKILKDRLPTAIENGKWNVKQNETDIANGVKLHNLAAYTDVHKLVEKLIGISKIV